MFARTMGVDVAIGRKAVGLVPFHAHVLFSSTDGRATTNSENPVLWFRVLYNTHRRRPLSTKIDTHLHSPVV